MHARLWAVISLLLTACATLMGPHSVEIPLAQLQDKIATRFPFNNRYLELLDVTVANPRVSLQPETNRIAIGMDMAIEPPFLTQPWRGNLAVSGNLKFDAARNALILGEPQIEQFAIEGLDSPYAKMIVRAASLLGEQLLDNMTLYTFRPEDLRYAGVNFAVSKITTKPGALVVTFEPVK